MLDVIAMLRDNKWQSKGRQVITLGLLGRGRACPYEFTSSTEG